MRAWPSVACTHARPADPVCSADWPEALAYILDRLDEVSEMLMSGYMYVYRAHF